MFSSFQSLPFIIIWSDIPEFLKYIILKEASMFSSTCMVHILAQNLKYESHGFVRWPLCKYIQTVIQLICTASETVPASGLVLPLVSIKAGCWGDWEQLCRELRGTGEWKSGHKPAVEAGPTEGHENDQRDGTSLLQGQAERFRAVQPAEVRASGRPYSSLPILKRDL